MSAEKIAQLQALYDLLPTIACKGLCENSCTAISMSTLEDARIGMRGVDMPDKDAMRLDLEVANRNGEKYRCPALVDGQCSVYDVRPMICRVWGVAESLPCEYGCQPDPGYLSDDATFMLLAKALLIGGDPDGDITCEADLNRLAKVIDTPEWKGFAAEYMKPWRERGGPHAK